MSDVRSRLVEARTEAGLTQTALARRAKLRSPSTIGNLESGAQKGSTSLPQIAHALGVNALWLQKGTGQKRPPSGVEEPRGNYAVSESRPLSPDEAAMLDHYRHLTKEQRNELLRRAEETKRANERILSELGKSGGNGTDG